jgi:hypothetical protein
MPQKAANTLLKRKVMHAGERPFWQEIEDILLSTAPDDTGFLTGSMTGESWRAYLQELRAEILDRLEMYRSYADRGGFCASTLGPYRDERQKIERVYLRNLTALYRNAERSYRTLSG